MMMVERNTYLSSMVNSQLLNKIKMNTENVEQNAKIVKLVEQGFTYKKIGEKFNLTKQRIGQIYKKHSNIDPRTARNERYYNDLINTINEKLNSGYSVKKIRKQLDFTAYDIQVLLSYGVDVRLIKKEVVKSRRLKLFNLYKQGKTAYEIINLVDGPKKADDVYRDIIRLNGSLPKRINSRDRKIDKLKTLIKEIGTKKTLTETFEILKNRGYKNTNGGELRFETIVYHYYH